MRQCLVHLLEKYEHTLNKCDPILLKKRLLLHRVNNHWGTFCVLATIIKGSEQVLKKLIFINFFINFLMERDNK